MLFNLLITTHIRHSWDTSDQNLFSPCGLTTQSCLTLCDTMDCSLPGSSIHVIVQSRILEWVAMPSSKGSSQPRDWIHVSCIAGRFFTTDYLGTHQYNTPPIMNCVLFFMQRDNKLEGLPYLHRFHVILHDLAARLSHFVRWQIIVKKHRNEQIIG